MPEASSLTPPRPAGRAAGLRALALEYLGLVLVILGLVAAFGLWEPSFVNLRTVVTIANQIPSTVILAVGMTYVLVIAGIDLSVGSVLALSGAVLGVAMKDLGAPLPAAAAAGLAAGLLCGLANGLVAVRWRLPSFIVTLGMLEIARGATHLVTGSRTQYLGSAVGGIAASGALDLSPPFLLALLAVAAGQVVLSRTVFGRYMVAIGTNEEAVRLAGVDPRPVKVAVFALSGLLASVAGIIETSRLQSADPNAGNGIELQVIAAVVLGGVSLTGGVGTLVGALLGILILTVLSNGLVL
ncbi:MAG: ABC transporter permease, partial [Planctomycetes bacterium]|nr:ABC transporter permease [Planctomycetota bacterium]